MSYSARCRLRHLHLYIYRERWEKKARRARKREQNECSRVKSHSQLCYLSCAFSLARHHHSPSMKKHFEKRAMNAHDPASCFPYLVWNRSFFFSLAPSLSLVCSIPLVLIGKSFIERDEISLFAHEHEVVRQVVSCLFEHSFPLSSIDHVYYNSVVSSLLFLLSWSSIES